MWNKMMVGMMIGEMKDMMKEALAILRGVRGKGRRRLVLWAKWHLEDGYHI